MRIIIFLCLSYIILVHSTNEEESKNMDDPKQVKRGIGEFSFSYAATDIGSKTGSHIKTITVIKNIADKKEKPIHIKPELHQNENWGTVFRDNFDSYGKIPEIPEIPNVDFFFNDHKKKTDGKEDKPDEKPEESPKVEQKPQRDSIPIYEEPEAQVADKLPEPTEQTSDSGNTEGEGGIPTEVTDEMTAKMLKEIPKDVELISISPINNKQAELSAKAQSLHLSSYTKRKDPKKQANPIKSDKNEPYRYTNSQLYYTADTSNNHNQYAAPEQYKTNYPVRADGYKSNKFAYVSTNSPQTSLKAVSFITTTGQPPYTAPKKIQTQANKAPRSYGYVTSSQKPYVAPKVNKPYAVPISSTPANNVQSSNPQNSFNGGYQPYTIPRYRVSGRY